MCAETRLLGSHFLCVECASFDLFSAGMLFSCTKKVRLKADPLYSDNQILLLFD